jgi:Protein of unknown function (DUF3349)
LSQLSLPPFLTAVIDWLREGYPQGIPERDYIPLLALLARRLTADEVAAVAKKLRDKGKLPANNADIGELIIGITDELPRQEDVARVRAQLALSRWPLADPHSASEYPDNL